MAAASSLLDVAKCLGENRLHCVTQQRTVVFAAIDSRKLLCTDRHAPTFRFHRVVRVNIILFDSNMQVFGDVRF